MCPQIIPEKCNMPRKNPEVLDKFEVGGDSDDMFLLPIKMSLENLVAIACLVKLR